MTLSNAVKTRKEEETAMMKITIDQNKQYKELGDLYGLFLEDLNHAADGGLYAELLCNRDFEFDEVDRAGYNALTAWQPIGNADISVDTADAPFKNNPHYAVVRAGKSMGICNLGYGDGIPAEAGKMYRFAIWARANDEMDLRVKLCGASKDIHVNTEWARYECELTPNATYDGARLSITALNAGTFYIAFTSLMPSDTWKGRKNGMRRDIVQAFYDMKPRFLRFPGGCLTHDGDLNPDARNGIYNWKRTVGMVENRPARRNNWGYHQSMGLGFYEYFLLCEDLNCEPLPVLNGGLDPHHLRFAEGELLNQYIQDAVDLIEFAKGGTDTKWGSVRAEMGHPAPFRLNYMAVGNEEIHERFHKNMELFEKAIRAKDPTIKLIGSASPVVAGKPYDMGWDYARKLKLDLVDEHYYQAPEWFIANWDHYADYPADGPKVFLGEYAAKSNKMRSALAEAAYMVGCERAPAVGLACYAPLLCNINYVNWHPDMLWYDNTRLMKTPNYHVQSMFMRNQGDFELPISATENEPGAPIAVNKAGKVSIQADDTDVRISSVTLTANGKTVTAPDTALSGREELNVADVQGDFHLEFDMQRMAGKKGILIHFNHVSQDDNYMWTAGGWQNSDCAIDRMIAGNGACLDQCNLYVKDDHKYHMVLDVKGMRITTYIDGEEMNRVNERELQIKPLYLSSSIDKTTGDIILKAVNVKATPVEAEIDVNCHSCKIETLCAAPDSENSLEAPDTVAPKVTEKEADGALKITFPGYSVCVVRMW